VGVFTFGFIFSPLAVMLPCEVRVCSLDRGEALLAMNFGADSLEQRFVSSVCWYMQLE